jgi:hypothetical protein
MKLALHCISRISFALYLLSSVCLFRISTDNTSLKKYIFTRFPNLHCKSAAAFSLRLNLMKFRSHTTTPVDGIDSSFRLTPLIILHVRLVTSPELAKQNCHLRCIQTACDVVQRCSNPSHCLPCILTARDVVRHTSLCRNQDRLDYSDTIRRFRRMQHDGSRRTTSYVVAVTRPIAARISSH